jgi:hypothetical protein
MSVSDFGHAAVRLARNPLGIVALFIVLIYAMASMVLLQAKLEVGERQPLIWFLVLFPAVVLGTFAWLVARHHTKLYGPGDFRNEENFVFALSPTARREKLEREVAETVAQGRPSTESASPESSEGTVAARRATPERRNLLGRHFLAEELVIRKLETEWKVPIQRQVGVADTGMDGVAVRGDEVVLVEVKATRSESSARNAVVQAARQASRAFDSVIARRRRVRLVIALALDYSKNPEALTAELNAVLRKEGFPENVECRVFCMSGLAAEFGVPFDEPIVLAG